MPIGKLANMGCFRLIFQDYLLTLELTHFFREQHLMRVKGCQMQ